MTNISVFNSFVEQCAQKYPSGIAVGAFVKELESMFGSRMINVIATPVAPSPKSVLEKLEEAKARGQAVPSFNAVKIAQHVQKQLAQLDTKALEPKLTQIGSKEELQPILTKKNMVWVQGAENKSLQEMIDEVKSGTGLYGLSEEVLDAVKKVLDIKKRVDLLFPFGGQAIFDKLALDASKDLVEQFFEAIPAVHHSFPCSKEEMATVHLEFSENLDDELQAAMEQSGSISPATQDEFSNLEIVELDDITTATVAEQISTAFSAIKFSHGDRIAAWAKEIISKDSTVTEFSLDIATKMGQIADNLRFALEDFREEYDEEIVCHIEKCIQFNSQDDLLGQLCAKAEKAIADHDEKMDDLDCLFSEDNEFGIDPRAKEYVFYTETLWPGYESEGKFALARPKANEFRYLDLDFVFTEQVIAKMEELADEYSLYHELLDIAKAVGADFFAAGQTYVALKNKRAALGERISLHLSEGELAWAQGDMSYFVTNQQKM